MAKRRKLKGNRNQGVQVANSSAFKSFDNAARVLFERINCGRLYSSLSKHERRLMFCFRAVIRNPEAAASYTISSKELKKIGRAIHFKIRHEIHCGGESSATVYELDIIRSLYSMMKCTDVTLSRREEFKRNFFNNNNNTDKGDLISFIVISAINSVMTFCDIHTHIYGIDVRVAKLIKENLEFELCFSLSKHVACRKHICINGMYRPVYAVGFPQYGLQVKWLKLESHFLKGAYGGCKEELAVYMQSHAKKRLTERLDLLEPSSIYYTIWLNTTDMDQFIIYKDYLLFPYELHNCKVGYLVADIIDDLVVFKTFLFITHSSTPEGDKLKQISGLGWKDISYWKIDRLSTFLKTDTEKYPGLIAMFEEAGLGGLFKLKDKEFDLDTFQDANLDALRDYIAQGKRERSEEFAW